MGLTAFIGHAAGGFTPGFPCCQRTRSKRSSFTTAPASRMIASA
jgi:hypothetical protein